MRGQVASGCAQSWARCTGAQCRPAAARIKEPKHYFLVEPLFTPGDKPEPEIIARYKKVLAIVDLLADVSSFLDETRAELVLVQEGKVVIPIRFKAADLSALNTGEADRLLGQFADELHRDQKQEILFRALLELCRAHAIDTRFERVLRNLGHLADSVSQGYKMFASSFSYAKIRGELDDARIEYTGKIHKTVFDIQNQLLGIPLATVIVASQMKVPTSCGIESWVNLAVLMGAWIFVLLLILAIVNQWLTLGVLKEEVGRQKTKLVSDYPTVSDDFVKTFYSLADRIWWHRSGLLVVGAIGLVGAILATNFYNKITTTRALPCAADAASAGAGVSPSSPANVATSPRGPSGNGR